MSNLIFSQNNIKVLQNVVCCAFRVNQIFFCFCVFYKLHSFFEKKLGIVSNVKLLHSVQVWVAGRRNVAFINICWLAWYTKTQVQGMRICCLRKYITCRWTNLRRTVPTRDAEQRFLRHPNYRTYIKYWQTFNPHQTWSKVWKKKFDLTPADVCKTAGWVANSVEPDQTPRSAASDLGLRYLFRHLGISTVPRNKRNWQNHSTYMYRLVTIPTYPRYYQALFVKM